MNEPQALPPAAYPVQVVAQPRTDGLSVASMVLGILWVFGLGSILAVIFGHVSLHHIKRDQQLRGRGMAIAGLVLGYIGVAQIVLLIVLAIIGAVAGQPSGPRG